MKTRGKQPFIDDTFCSIIVNFFLLFYSSSWEPLSGNGQTWVQGVSKGEGGRNLFEL